MAHQNKNPFNGLVRIHAAGQASSRVTPSDGAQCAGRKPEPGGSELKIRGVLQPRSTAPRAKPRDELCRTALDNCWKLLRRKPNVSWLASYVHRTSSLCERRGDRITTPFTDCVIRRHCWNGRTGSLHDPMRCDVLGAARTAMRTQCGETTWHTPTSLASSCRMLGPSTKTRRERWDRHSRSQAR